MVINRLGIVFSFFLLFAGLVSFSLVLAEMSSSNYVSSSTTIRSGGGETSSSNYSTTILISDIAGTLSDALYSTSLGFFSATASSSPSLCGLVLETYGEQYTLSQDILDCTDDYIVNITASDVLFDCAGYFINGTGNYGIYVTGDNVTVKNCIINLTGATSGIGLQSYLNTNFTALNNTVQVAQNTGIQVSSGGSLFTLVNNTVIAGLQNGFSLGNSDGIYLSGNTITSWSNAISVGSTGALIEHNTLITSYGGGFLTTGDNNLISENTFSGGRQGINLQSGASNNTFINNNFTVGAVDTIYDISTAENALIYSNSYALINWTSTNLSVSEAGVLGLGHNITLTNNSIFVNDINFASLAGKPANLTFFSPGVYPTPLALLNGSLCPDTVCSVVANDSSNYWFNVSHFTTYSIGGDEYPYIVFNPILINSTTTHSFNITAGVNISIGASAITSATITNTQGTCQNVFNSSIGDYFNATFTCTGTPHLFTNSSLTFCAGSNCNTTSIVNNSYPNQAPSMVTLLVPTDGNLTIHDLRPTFNWTASTDPEGDLINYTFNLTTNVNCQPLPLLNVTDVNFTPSQDLCPDSLKTYNWTVQACDTWDCGSWSAEFSFILEPFIDITLVTNTIDFGSLELGQQKNTTSGTPAPFDLRNDGNVYADMVNITVDALNPLWDAASLGTSYFQAKARLPTGNTSFNSTGSVTSWQDLFVSNPSFITEFNYTDSNDRAYVDINVEVPPSEPVGSKSTTLYFVWQQTPYQTS